MYNKTYIKNIGKYLIFNKYKFMFTTKLTYNLI